MDNLEQRINQLADIMNSTDSHLIDPVQFGEMKGSIAALQREMNDIKMKQASIDGKLDIVVGQLAHAKGGWKMLMALGGGAGTLGALIATAMGKGVP